MKKLGGRKGRRKRSKDNEQRVEYENKEQKKTLKYEIKGNNEHLTTRLSALLTI